MFEFRIKAVEHCGRELPPPDWEVTDARVFGT